VVEEERQAAAATRTRAHGAAEEERQVAAAIHARVHGATVGGSGPWGIRKVTARHLFTTTKAKAREKITGLLSSLIEYQEVRVVVTIYPH
uniref:Uncharacterized protein n=1 Tax=Aegilops tauschii subsp. strangulata TaxID=200361 RepID=A0A453KXU0_AEGTS